MTNVPSVALGIGLGKIPKFLEYSSIYNQRVMEYNSDNNNKLISNNILKAGRIFNIYNTSGYQETLLRIKNIQKYNIIYLVAAYYLYNNIITEYNEIDNSSTEEEALEFFNTHCNISVKENKKRFDDILKKISDHFLETNYIQLYNYLVKIIKIKHSIDNDYNDIIFEDDEDEDEDNE